MTRPQKITLGEMREAPGKRVSVKYALPISLWLTLALCNSALAQPAPAAPAEMISSYRLQHGEGRVTVDSTGRA